MLGRRTGHTPGGPHNEPSEEEEGAGANLSLALLRRVWELVRSRRGLLLAFLLVVAAGAGVSAVPPLIVRVIVDSAIPDGNRSYIVGLSLLIIVLGLAEGLANVAGQWLAARIGAGVVFDLRVRLFEHVQRMPLAFFTRTHTGALVNRLNSDVNGAQQALSFTVGSALSHIITLVVTVGAMLVLEWRLTLLALLLVPVLVYPTRWAGRRLRVITREGMNVSAGLTTQMTERFDVAGALLAQVYADPERERAQFVERARALRGIAVRSATLMGMFGLTLGFVGTAATAVVYLFGGLLTVSGTLTVGVVVALGVYTSRLYAPLSGLANARVQLVTALVAFERAFELLDFVPNLADRPRARQLTHVAGRIELIDVWFRYPEGVGITIPSLSRPTPPTTSGGGADGAILRGVSAKVDPGQLVAIVGPSGAGKTTLSMLIPRFYEPIQGSVKIDGHDVRDLTQRSLRQSIGIVAQDTYLFHDSVAANLRYVRPHATQRELEAACIAAQIHDVIAALPHGYDTIVGERGHRLSGGEKQRLAIARLLIADPAIVILDEATSQLDAENESAVQKALATALAGRTAFVIAHRLSTITKADQILVLNGGRIIERGRHHDLLAADGLYAELYYTLVGGSRHQHTMNSPM